MKKEKLREVPIKNYIILGVVTIVTCLLLYYFYMWCDVYNETKLNRPILDKYMNMINYNEIDNFIVENPDSIIYVSVLEDTEIREFEKKLKNSFKNKEILRDLLYLDLTEELKSREMNTEIKQKYVFNSINMSDVPCLLVISNGELKYIYSLRDNGNDIDRFVAFINGISFKDSDING